MLTESNRKLLHQLNRRMLKRARDLLSVKMTGERFRSTLHADEGLEMSGLEAFDLGQSAEHIDFGRLQVPWRWLVPAIINQNVVVRRFERQPEQDFFLILDLSQSMRYPLRQLYANELTEFSWRTLLTSKPALMKLVAGAFLNSALESGFRVRLIHFNGLGIVESPPWQRGRHSVMDLFRRVDVEFERLTQQTPQVPTQDFKLLTSLASRPGVFVFIGDFQDALAEWGDSEGRRRWRHYLAQFEDWALRRSVSVVRINHRHELAPITNHQYGQWDPRNESPGDFWTDDCDVDVEQRSFVEPQMQQAEVNRLESQADWTQLLERTMRRCCRGYAALHDQDSDRDLTRHLISIWSELVEPRRR